MAAGSLRERAEARARDALRQAAEPLARAGLAVELDLRREPAAEAILAGAAEQGADLIVMSTHGRGGLDRVAHGSVADRVLRAAAVPVLLVRAGAAATAAPRPAAGDLAG
jgi:nucleotide-binding universal stress UspA family protein